MGTPLVTYLHDHLAGARFAVSLLQDLSAQLIDADAAELAATLLPQIEDDRTIVENLASDMGDEASELKEALSWFAQKASRLKLTMSTPEGVFEAIEVVSLGVLGKLALWNTLRTLAPGNDALAKLELLDLCDRAERQHAALEALRRQLANKAFGSGTLT